MRSEILSQEKNFVSIKVEFEAAEFTKNINKAVKDLAAKVNIPGFRKGHAPRKILEMRLGKQALHVEALELMMPDAIDEIVTDYELDLIDEPSLKVDKMEEGTPVEVTLTFEVSPEIVLPELSDIVIEKSNPVVTDEMVEEMVQELRRERATLVSVEGSPVGEDHVVEIEYYTVVKNEDGGEDDEGRYGPETTTVNFSQEGVKEEIREALLGKEKGAAAEALILVEEGYPDKNLVGKTLKYEMTVVEIKETVLPDLDLEFFKKILGKDMESEEQFREKIKELIQKKLENESQNQAEFSAVDQISQKAELEVPETLIARQASAMRKEDEERLQRAGNISLEQYMEDNGVSQEQYDDDIRKQAEVLVRRSLVLDKVAEELEISVEKEDFEAEMSQMASTYNLEVERLVDSLFKDEKRLIQTANRIKYQKTSKAIMDKVQVTEISPESPEAQEQTD